MSGLVGIIFCLFFLVDRLAERVRAFICVCVCVCVVVYVKEIERAFICACVSEVGRVC